MGYVHLHCHSAYSLLEGTATPQALVATAKKLNMPALALTDRHNLYGAVPFYLLAQKAGIKPLIGMEVTLDDGFNLVLLARNSTGYRNLCHLATAVRLTGDPEAFQPSIDDDEWGGEWATQLAEDIETWLARWNGDEIPPWDPGVWGVPILGFTPKPLTNQRGQRRATTSNLAANLATWPSGKDPHLPRAALLSGRHARGLIALSGGRRGAVNALVREGKIRQAAKAAGALVSAFGEGNFFIQLEALDRSDDAAMVPLADLAHELGIPVVASNDVLYLTPADATVALALAAARQGKGKSQRPPLFVSPEGELSGSTELEEAVGRERYFKSAEQMAELFGVHKQAIANTHYIAEQCDLALPLGKPMFPSIELGGRASRSEGRSGNASGNGDENRVESAKGTRTKNDSQKANETAYSKLWKLAFAGATRLYRPLTEPVMSRLKYEVEIIEKLGFSAYFLIVHDIARFAHSRDIPITARGSAADSLVAFTLGITQVDPIKNDLPFERFLNTSRAEYELPDIDLDLCWRRRDDVLRYVYEKYGRANVAIVGTHITFRLRSAWREMAKALGVPAQRVSYVGARLDDIAATANAAVFAEPASGGGAFKDARLTETENNLDIEDMEPSLEYMDQMAIEWSERASIGVAEAESAVKKIKKKQTRTQLRDVREEMALQLAGNIEGLPRHAGMHCAAVVISPGPIADIVPLQRSARDPGLHTTQYDKDAIEAMGLVKMDLLGSRALTTLTDALVSSGLARGAGDVASGLEAIPVDDERTYRMLAEGSTLGCFQLESPGMRGLLKWLRPRSLEDIAVAISLFRPGPLEGGFLEAFMRRHLGEERVSYHHPSMEPILKSTHGVILFQEQFLRLAHELGGMGLGEAEQLRKALGKARSPEERARLGEAFVAGAIEGGIDQLQAEKVWEIIAGYSGFGFCKAHACSYALVAYRTAYLKAHYPAHFLAAQINNQGGFYGTTVYVEEARRLRIELLPPDVNESGLWCGVPPGSQGKSRRSIRFGLAFVKGLSERTIDLILSERRRERFRTLWDLVARVEASQAELTSLVKAGACDSLGLETDLELSPDLPEPPELPHLVNGAMPRLVPTQGVLGEPEGALYVPNRAMTVLNRKQMVWLLPSLIAARQGTTGRTLRRNKASKAASNPIVSAAAEERLTGSDGKGLHSHTHMQMFMDSFGDSAALQRDYGYGHSYGYSNTPFVSGGPKVLGRRGRDGGIVPHDIPQMEDYTPAEKLILEQAALGFALTHNPIALYGEVIARSGGTEVVASDALAKYAQQETTVAGMIVAGRRHISSNGEPMLFLTLQDAQGLIEVVMFSDAYKRNSETLASGGHGPYLVRGQVQVAGAGRGVGVQPSRELLYAVPPHIKPHPVLIASEVRPVLEFDA